MNRKFASWMGVLGVLAIAQSTAFAEQWGEIDKLKEFVSRDQVITNVNAIESMGLLENILPPENRPWSDTFWPDVKGSIAYPYAEGNLLTAINFLSWGISRPYVSGRDELHRNILTASQDTLDNLSPAEKYDLLMGDTRFTLWQNVVKMLDVRNSPGVDLVAYFTGVCHGWSPASLTLPRPEHSIQIASPLGRVINFYPSDIKALASFLWGKSPAQSYTKVEGWQCQSGATGNKYGRLVDPRCFDVNPGFFHLVAVNQIGLNKHGFIMDRNFKSEVQNQPVFAYRFRYYRTTDRHPRPGMTLEQAKVPVDQGWDPHKPFRSLKAKWIVGVEATLWYGMETDPDHGNDSQARDKHRDFTIRYDLELDANGDIVGGEWREHDDASAPTLFEQLTYQHPDIIWLVPPGTNAWSVADYGIRDLKWDGKGHVPTQWREAAVMAANYVEEQTIKGKQVQMPTPQPLAKVVELLIELSRK